MNRTGVAQRIGIAMIAPMIQRLMLWLCVVAAGTVLCASTAWSDAPKASPPLANVPATLTQQEGAEAFAGLVLLPFGSQTCREVTLTNAISGVLVGFIAGHTPLQVCDLVIGVDGRAVRTPTEMATKLKDAVKAGQASVLLLIDRHGDKSYVSLALPPS